MFNCKKFFRTMLLTLLSCFSATTLVNAAPITGKILFIPHDDRPISYHQTIEVIEQAGYEIVAPPKNLLNVFPTAEQPDELWQWLFENVKGAKSVVVSSDSLLYGGLIPSRKHEVTEEILNQRLENFSKLRAENPDLKIYVFDSLMRTPYEGTKGDIEEPEYYAEHGANIFQYSMFADKKEISTLTDREEISMRDLKNKIPAEIFSDWLARREKNIYATKNLMKMTAENVINYLILGRDDNSHLSQTHKENREIKAYAKDLDLPKEKFQSMPGIDEFNLLLLTRAVNEMRGEVPTVAVKFNKGKGGNTVPAFSDEKISASIDASITIACAKKISDAHKANFVFLVNTDEGGQTFWGHNEAPSAGNFEPKLTPSQSTKNFVKLVEESLEKKLPVGIADINFANGSDNALMKILQEKNLLFKLQSYAGWNTATNSTGFALATGILAKNMSITAREKILMRRYLDDWGYQANVRSIVSKEIFKKFGDPSVYYQFQNEEQRNWAENLNTELLKDFAEKNLQHAYLTQDLKVKNTWNRMFECDIEF